MKKFFWVSSILLGLIIFLIVINIWIDKRNIEKYGDFFSENEFLRTIDCAPIFDSNPSGTRYKISFDLRTKTPGEMIIYQQNGNDHRYWWKPCSIKTTTDFVHYEIIIDPVLTNDEVKEAYLSFYGEYGSGVIPVVMNIVIEPT